MQLMADGQLDYFRKTNFTLTFLNSFTSLQSRFFPVVNIQTTAVMATLQLMCPLYGNI